MEDQQQFIDEMISRVGKRLRALRKENGYTNHEKFAYKHDISRSQYGAYEKGTDMRLTTFFKLLSILKISPREFFSEEFTLPKDES